MRASKSTAIGCSKWLVRAGKITAIVFFRRTSSTNRTIFREEWPTSVNNVGSSQTIGATNFDICLTTFSLSAMPIRSFLLTFTTYVDDRDQLIWQKSSQIPVAVPFFSNSVIAWNHCSHILLYSMMKSSGVLRPLADTHNTAVIYFNASSVLLHFLNPPWVLETDEKSFHFLPYLNVNGSLLKVPDTMCFGEKTSILFLYLSNYIRERLNMLSVLYLAGFLWLMTPKRYLSMHCSEDANGFITCNNITVPAPDICSNSFHHSRQAFISDYSSSQCCNLQSSDNYFFFFLCEYHWSVCFDLRLRYQSMTLFA